MKPKIPFTIRRCHYENLEFDLEVLELGRVGTYDVYLYIGKGKKFLKYIPYKTELVFYWERLEIATLWFINMNLKGFTELSHSMEELFGKPEIDIFHEKERHIFTKRNVEYWMILYPDGSVKVMYGIAKKLCFWDIFGID